MPKIVLGVSASIAAVKAAKLASDMIADGFQVRAVLTEGATHFVAPLTFEALTGNPVAVNVWDEQPGSTRMGHLELARWTDAVVVAPASADLLARLALGLADDMLSAVVLASRVPLILAPAMETTMYQHPSTQEHLATLRARGALVVGPESGRLASGAHGEGRMSEPEAILSTVRGVLERRDELSDLKVLVTAGPTFEPIDPVRFIGNRSSGKMGYAVAEEARERGAEVVLVSGPTALPPPTGVQVINVETAQQMRDAVLAHAAESNVVVMAAAVADFRPTTSTLEKLKRSGTMALDLTPTPDIAAEVAAAVPRAVHVGFALETGNLIQAARAKLRRKGQTLVVANAVSPEHNPFGADTNRVVFVTEDAVNELPEMSKREVARALWSELAPILARRRESY